jgi:acyl carrier protein
MNEKLLSLLSDTLGLAPAMISRDSSMTNTPAWDSLMHLNLCLSVEKAFGIRLTPEEILGMSSVRAIEAVLARHQAV